MPESTLKFQLPEEEVECDQAHKAGDYNIVVCDLREWLRRKADTEESGKSAAAYQDCFNYLQNLIEEHKLPIE